MRDELSSHQIDFYRGNGFLVIEDFLDPTEVEHLREIVFEAAAARGDAVTPADCFVVDELRRLGFRVRRRPRNYDDYFARPQVIAWNGSRYRGASDPRKDGGFALEVGPPIGSGRPTVTGRSRR